MLQTRHGKRTGTAAIRIACDMEQEGLVDRDEALMMVEPDHLDQLLHDQIDPEADLTVLGTGLPASPGAAQGGIKFTAEDAVAAAKRLICLLGQSPNFRRVHGHPGCSGRTSIRFQDCGEISA